MRYPYPNELYHFGILGMKWGVRRYQNPDGSLTEEGRQRYAKNYISVREKPGYPSSGKYNRLVKSANLKVSPEASEKLKTLASGTDFGAYQRALGEVESDLERQANELLGEYANQKITLTWNKDGTTIGKDLADRYIRQKEAELEDILKNSSAQRCEQFAKKNDLIRTSEGSDDYYSSKEKRKRYDHAADLGLLALNTMSPDSNGWEDVNQLFYNLKDYRDWFMWEDQTIGLTTIADQVLQGKSKSQIKQMIKDAKKECDYVFSEPTNGVWELAYAYDADKFIDACIKVRDNPGKKETEFLNGTFKVNKSKLPSWARDDWDDDDD